MDLYITWVKAYPITSAMLQFAILGTSGEIISKWVVQKSFKYPFTALLTIWKMIVWAILAIGIKLAFKGFTGYAETLMHSGYLPEFKPRSLGHAFSVSALMNLQFGLFLVIMHRILDNIPEKVKNWKNLHKSMYSLLWFWIPAHTVTFMLADDLRIGLAAIWSLALGLILGFYNRK